MNTKNEFSVINSLLDFDSSPENSVYVYVCVHVCVCVCVYVCIRVCGVWVCVSVCVCVR